MKKIQSVRREYGSDELIEARLAADPFKQFETWLNEALDAEVLDPTSMVLATVDKHGFPDTRVVLLKEFDSEGFVFFTHYTSPKAIQAEKIGVVALNFYWKEFSRQVRIKGKIERVSREESEQYFVSRPRESQLGALISKQSTVIKDRMALENAFKEIAEKYENKEIACPETWGGYRVVPFEFEFFQGRDNRLNDRIRYVLKDGNWIRERLSP